MATSSTSKKQTKKPATKSATKKAPVKTEAKKKTAAKRRPVKTETKSVIVKESNLANTNVSILLGMAVEALILLLGYLIIMHAA